MNKTKIDWADSSWNPVTGCLHGCEYCYARRIARRFGSEENEDGICHFLGIPQRKGFDFNGATDPYPYGFDPTFHRYRLDIPKRWTKPRNIFVCSMADLFGDWVPDEWIREVFKACEAAPQHNYMFLTKNPQRYGIINSLNHRYDWEFAKDNWWFGMTITNKDDLNILRHLPYGKTNTFLSIEPIQSEIDLSFYIPSKTKKWKCSNCGYHSDFYSFHCENCACAGGYSGSFRKYPINWVIIGAETGNRKDKVTPKREWIENIVNQCRDYGIPVFMKSSLETIWGEPLIQEFPWEEDI